MTSDEFIEDEDEFAWQDMYVDEHAKERLSLIDALSEEQIMLLQMLHEHEAIEVIDTSLREALGLPLLG